MQTNPPSLGVVLVSFNSSDVIVDCLESLLAAKGVRLEIVVVDNASTDGTPTALSDWASGRVPYVPPSDIPFPLVPASKPLTLLSVNDLALEGGHSITLIESGVNGGFAAGINQGLSHLMSRPALDRFWILNPDCVAPPDTPQSFANEPSGVFGLMGGRVLYLDSPDTIQIDGGTIARRTGVTGNSGLYQPHATTPPPDPSRIDFITGASVVASRAFIDHAGLMPEDYFLYYEEVDWALRRGSLPLAYCAGGIVYHRAGTSIGSATLGRPASPFSLYFKHRGRMRFLRRHLPRSVATGLAYSVAKAGQLGLRGYVLEARAIMAGSLELPPPASVRERLSKASQALAFSRLRG